MRRRSRGQWEYSTEKNCPPIKNRSRKNGAQRAVVRVTNDDSTDAAWPNRQYLQPFPPYWEGALRYSTRGTLLSTTSGVCGTEWVFRLNSLFDPDFTYTGHQPYGFDQLASVYGQYLVYAVDIEIIASDPSADGAAICAVVQPSQASATVAGKTDAQVTEMEFGAVAYVNNTGSQKARLQRRFGLALVEGISRTQYVNQISSYGAAVSASPSLSPWLRVGCADIREISGTSCVVTINLTYSCRFYRRNTLTQS